MAKTGVKYNLETGQILGIVETSVDSDLELNIDYGQGVIEIPPDHPFRSEQKNWYIEKVSDSFGGILKRKLQTEIDEEEKIEKEHKTKLETFAQRTRYTEIEVLLDFFNELRPGKPPITLEELTFRKNTRVKLIREELGLKEENERFNR